MKFVEMILRRYKSIEQLVDTVSAGNETAIEDLLKCLGGTTFRFIRYRTSGHLTARSITEQSFVRFIRWIQYQRNDQPLDLLFNIVVDFLNGHISYNPGKGLSAKQHAMIQCLEKLNWRDRFVVELILDSGVSIDNVTGFFGGNPTQIQNLIRDIQRDFESIDDIQRGERVERKRSRESKPGYFQENQRAKPKSGKHRKYKKADRSEDPRRRHRG